MIAKRDLIHEAVLRLTEAGVDTPRQEAQRLLEWASGHDALALLRLSTVSATVMEKFRKGLERRVAREPMAFIRGWQGFWTLEFEVSPDTLIPRADSESLVEALLAVRPERETVRSCLDLGTGTGCLLLAALSEYPYAFGIGVDLTVQAALLAQRNAHRNGLAARTAFLVGHWADMLEGTFDVVLSNPPYIEKAALVGLMPEVRHYEPVSALDGGEDGLASYRLVCEALPRLLKASGCAVIELGVGQEEAVTRIAMAQGLRVVTCRHDLGNLPRALVLEK